MNALQLILHYTLFNFRIRMVKPFELFLDTVFVLITDIFGLYLLIVILKVNRTFDDWSNSEVMILYGYVLIISSISRFISGDLKSLGRKYIREGLLDSMLIRPSHTLLQLIIGDIDIKHLGSMLMGIFITVYYIGNHITSYFALLMLVINIVFGVLVHFSISVMITSTDFWTKSIINPLYSIEELSQLTFFPLSIYPKVFKIILFYVLPYAFSGYVQVSLFLGKINPAFYVVQIVASAALFVLALFVWQLGIEKYESIT